MMVNPGSSPGVKPTEVQFMRKECTGCQYGTSQRGQKGDKAMRRHFDTTGHNKPFRSSKIGTMTLGRGAKK